MYNMEESWFHAQGGTEERIIAPLGSRLYKIDIEDGTASLVDEDNRIIFPSFPQDTRAGRWGASSWDGSDSIYCKYIISRLNDRWTDYYFKIDINQGTATLLFQQGFNESTRGNILDCLAWDGENMYGVKLNDMLCTIDLTNGNITDIGDTGQDISYLCWNGSSLYGYNSRTNRLYSINKETGVSSLVVNLATPGNSRGLAWNGLNFYTFEYVPSRIDLRLDKLSLAIINTTTGAKTKVSDTNVLDINFAPFDFVG